MIDSADRGDNRERFSGRAELYAAARPSYSQQFIHDLAGQYGCGRHTAAADIGSGTGKMTKQLLELGCRVYAVEPNEDMRRQAEQELGKYPGFCSVEGDASDTHLKDRSADVILAAQAFHWFDPEEFRRECCRIGKAPCPVFLIWNQRDPASPVTQEIRHLYETYGKGFHGFNNGLRDDDERIRVFFRDEYVRKDYPNNQYSDRDTFLRRCLSSSHAPKRGEESEAAYVREVQRIFDTRSVDGILEIPTFTTVYTGILKPLRMSAQGEQRH